MRVIGGIIRLICCLTVALCMLSFTIDKPKFMPQEKQDTIITIDTIYSEGDEFWLTYMYQDVVDTVELKLIFSSRYNTNVRISNPYTGWSTSAYVNANNLTELVMPLEQCYASKYDGSTEYKGVFVESDQPISLYATNFHAHTFDATNVLPIKALGSEYIIQTYIGEIDTAIASMIDFNYADYAPNFITFDTIDSIYMMVYEAIPASFAVLGTENNTQVRITPSANTFDGHLAGVPYDIILNAGEVYQAVGSDVTPLSGSYVQSSKNVAVFNGDVCSYVPFDIKACDHLVEQALPISLWGNTFVVSSSYGQYADQVLLTAVYDSTEIYIDDSLVVVLNARQTYEFSIYGSQEALLVTSNQPVACYLYLTGAMQNSLIGDPSMVWITPIEQRIKQITFATFQTSQISNHYVNIVTSTAAVAGMTLDGADISYAFKALSSNPQYSYARIDIPHGVHTLRNPLDGFVAHVYGLGNFESYAYNVGSLLQNLKYLYEPDPIVNWSVSTHCDKRTLVDVEYNAQVKVDSVFFKSLHSGYQKGYSFLPPNRKILRFTDNSAGRDTILAYSYVQKELVQVDTLSFDVNYSSDILLQKWADFIGILTEEYNGGETFVEYQWFKNGEPLLGETSAYLYQDLTIGAEYSALLTNSDGVKAMTCPIVATQKFDVAPFPTVVEVSQLLRNPFRTNSQMRIYTMSGILVRNQMLNGEDRYFEAPSQSGQYVVQFITASGSIKSFKLVVM